jgi:hypothetical protein
MTGEMYYEKLKSLFDYRVSQLLRRINSRSKLPSVCSCVVYCRCSKHQSMAVLFVKCEFKGVKGRYVLPGGKRDIAGKEGRVKHL